MYEPPTKVIIELTVFQRQKKKLHTHATQTPTTSCYQYVDISNFCVSTRDNFDKEITRKLPESTNRIFPLVETKGSYPLRIMISCGDKKRVKL